MKTTPAPLPPVFERIRCSCGCGNRIDGKFQGQFYSWPCIWQEVRKVELQAISDALAAGERT